MARSVRIAWGLVIALIMGAAVPTVLPQPAQAAGCTTASPPLSPGEVVLGSGRPDGIFYVYNASGVNVGSGQTCGANDQTTGMAFSADGSLLMSEFSGNTVSSFDPSSGRYRGHFGTADPGKTWFWCAPESIGVAPPINQSFVRGNAAASDVFVGQAQCSNYLLRFSTDGQFKAAYAAQTEQKGVDWVAVNPNNPCEVYYTSEGIKIFRYDVCAGGGQRADYVSDLDSEAMASGGPCSRLLGGGFGSGCRAYAIKFLPDGGMLVADTQRVIRLNSSGLRVREYDLPPQHQFGLDLDPDGTSFWVSDFIDGTLMKVDIAGGQTLASTRSPSGRSAGLAVVPRTTLEATGIEVTQVTQNVANTDLLVADKQTYAVVRARTTGGDVPAVGVTASLVNDDTKEAVKPQPRWDRVTLIGKPSRDDSVHAFVFKLPMSWTRAGTLHLTAKVNPDASPPDVPHTTTATVTFTASTASLDIAVVNLMYHSDSTGFIRPHARGTADQVKAPVQVFYPLPEGRVTATLLPDQELPFDAMNLAVDGSGKDLPQGQTRHDHCKDVGLFLQGLIDNGTIKIPDDTILYGLMPDVKLAGTDATSVYGDRDTGDGSIHGCANEKSQVATGIAPLNGDTTFMARTLLHEVGHLLDFAHVTADGCKLPDPPWNFSYPDADGGTIGGGSVHTKQIPGTDYHDVGFDWGNSTDPIVPGSYGDIMTYCDHKAMSDYTYEESGPKLVDPHPGAGVGGNDIAGTPNALSISGTVDSAYEAAVLADVATGHQGGTFPADQPGPYHVRLFDAAGALLADHPFQPMSAANDTDAAPVTPDTLGSFSEVIPFPSGTSRVAVYSDRSGRELVSRAVSPHAPTVTVTAPDPGSALPADGSLSVSWTGADADNDPLSYAVVESSDGGTTWRPIAEHLTGTSASVDATQLAGAVGNGIIRVVANDGANIGYADSAALTIPAKAPTVTIDGPAKGATATTAASVALDGSASDLQIGTLPDSALSWSSDRDGPLGAGAHIVASGLSVGTHVITLTAANAQGQASTATTTITVGPDVPTPATLNVSPNSMTIPYGESSGTVTRTAAVDNLGTGTVNWTAASDNARVSVLTTPGSPPDLLRFTADTSGLPAGGTTVAHITVTADGAAASPQVLTVTLASTRPGITIQPQQLGFGARVVGAPPTTRSVTLTNSGGGALSLGASTVTGGTPGDFSLTADTCAGASVPAGGSCTVTVAFVSAAAGERIAYLTIGTATPWHVPLTGSGVVLPVAAGTTVVAWGDNLSGQAGVTPSSTPCNIGYACAPTPVTVAGLANVSAVSAGGSHDLALEGDGTVWAWGANYRGQLGLGTTDSLKYTTPQRIPAPSNVTAVAAGDGFSLALTADGTVWGWGQDDGGNINGCFCNVLTPVPVFGPASAIAVGTQPGGNNLISYALRTDGTVWQWGDFGDFGFVITAPHPIPGPDGTGALSGIVAVAHRMALKSDGTVWTWGDGGNGQLGTGSRPKVAASPVQVLAPGGVTPLTHVVAIGSGANQRYAVKDDGTVLAWGDGTPSSSVGADYIVGTSDGIALGVGGVFNLNGFALPVPVVAPGGSGPLSGVAAVTPGLAVRDDGTAFAWGQALIGQLGNGTYLYNPWSLSPNGSGTPVQVHGIGGTGVLSNITAISGGYAHLAIVGGQPRAGASVPPPVTGTPARAPDAAGWYNHPVTITWDSTASAAACDGATNYTGPDGSGLDIVGYCLNAAGRTGSTTATINYDATAPTTTATVSGTRHDPGYAPPVTVALPATDAVSGVAHTYYTLDADPTAHVYDAPVTLTTSGYHQLTFWSQDRAGNVEAHDDDAHTVWVLVVDSAGALDHLVLHPATGSIAVGTGQAYTAEGFDADGIDLGDVTLDTTFTITPDGSCTSATCTPQNVGPHTVTGASDGATGTTTLTATAVPVTLTNITMGPVPPNTSVQFSDTATVSATVTAASPCCGLLTGTVTFTVNGNPAAGTSAPVSTSTGTATVTAKVPLSAATIPAGAGSYQVRAVFTSSTGNYADATGSASASVAPETGTLTYTGDYYDPDTKAPTISVSLDQRSPAADAEFIDYSASQTWVRFDITQAASTTPSQTIWKRVANASEWATTGRGTASATLSAALPDGSYIVTGNLVATGSSTVGQTSPFVVADESLTTLTSSPTTGSFVTGGGFIAPDASANTADTHGNFGFVAKFNKSGTNLQGNSVYVYRVNMDVGGGTMRHVDVRVKSNSLSYQAATQTSTTSGTAVVTGKFSVQYIDAITGTDYTQFDFGNGTFQLNVIDGGAGGSADQYAIAIRRPDGTLFHVSTLPFSSSNGSGTQVLLGGGNITVHP